MHFVLVHGAYHGAWCWDQLRAELERGGHASTAVDLPCDDPDAGAERYVDEVLHAIPKQPDAVVMVGHSLAGLTIPIAASRVRTAMTIYLCAVLPVPGLSFDAQHAESGTGFQPSEPAVGHEDGSASWPERGAIEIFFHDCIPEVAQAAARQLRPQYWKITQEVTPLRQWPPVPATSALMTAWCRRTMAVAQLAGSWASIRSSFQAGTRRSCPDLAFWPRPWSAPLRAKA